MAVDRLVVSLDQHGFCWMFFLLDFDGCSQHVLQLDMPSFLVFSVPGFSTGELKPACLGLLKKHLQKLCHPIAVWDTTGKLVGPFNVPSGKLT